MARPVSGQSRTTVKLGRLWVRSVETRNGEPRWSVRCYLGENPPKVIDGYGGWQITARPRRKGLTEWIGTNPIAVEVQFLIDDFQDGAERGSGIAVEALIRDLESMAGLDKDMLEPPLVIWNANAPHDHTEASHLRWVIESLEWDDRPYRNEAGNRVRQGGTFVLRVHEGDEFLSTAAELARNKSKKNKKSDKKTRTHKVKKGETLQSIAKKEHVKGGWQAILKLNKKNVRDPRHLKEGTVLRLP